MIFILAFVLFISACDTSSPHIIGYETSDCIDTGENIECASSDKVILKRASDKEVLGFVE